MWIDLLKNFLMMANITGYFYRYKGQKFKKLEVKYYNINLLMVSQPTNYDQIFLRTMSIVINQIKTYFTLLYGFRFLSYCTYKPMIFHMIICCDAGKTR